MEHGLVNDIAICIVVAWVLAVVAQLLRQPLILAYLTAGFVIGPVGIGLIVKRDSIATISELGLILLLFMIGLEIDLKKMLGSGRLIVITGVSQIIGGTALGVGAFWLLGFPLNAGELDALYLAVAAALSSTVIVVKLLYDKRELDSLAGRLTLGILVLQDLFAILFLAIQPNLKDLAAAPVFLALGKVGLLVGIAFLASRYALPPLFRAVARLPELVLVGALAWCFLMAGVAGKFGLSREMGALVAGVAISTFPYALDVTAKVTSLRDFFVTLFFVALGMGIQRPSWSMVSWAAVLACFVVTSRVITVSLPLHRLSMGHRISLLPAIHLSQISELSLVILALGMEAGQVSAQTVGITAYAFALTAVTSTYVITQVEPLLHAVSRLLTRIRVRDLARSHGETHEAGGHGGPATRVFLLGCSWTGSSLVEELGRKSPALLKEMTVVDFNPLTNRALRDRGIRTIYGDVGQRDTLLHAGVEGAELIISTLSNTLLKGTSNLRLVQQLRELNPRAKIIAHADLFSDLPRLYAAGADYVCVPRLVEAVDLMSLVEAALSGSLPERRTEQKRELVDRREVIP